MQINQHHTNNIAFGKFYKVKGNHHDIKRLRNNFFEKDNKFLTLSVKKDDKKRILYLFSGKDFDKFIDLTKKVIFFDLRHNVEKFMPNKPQKISIKEAKNLLDK